MMEERKGHASAGNKDYTGLSCIRESADVRCVLLKGMQHLLAMLALVCSATAATYLLSFGLLW